MIQNWNLSLMNSRHLNAKMSFLKCLTDPFNFVLFRSRIEGNDNYYYNINANDNTTKKSSNYKSLYIFKEKLSKKKQKKKLAKKN